jgi:hypothetical protein
MEELQGGRAVAEARAHVHAAMAALQGGTPGVATRELVNYVVDLKNHDYANLADNGKAKRGAAVMDALTHEIQTAYRQMSPDMRHELETAIAGAKQQNPDAWLSKVTLQR